MLHKKDKNLEGKKIFLLKPVTWEEVDDAVNNGKENSEDKKNSVIALDAVGAGAAGYVFYVSSKEACQAFEDDPVCHNAVVGIIDGIQIKS